MKKKIKNISYYIILILLATFVVLQVVFPDVGMKVFHFRTFIIAPTGSMEPELTYMDFIFVVKGNFDEIIVRDDENNIKGDYIVFYDYIDGKYQANTHEVIEVKIIDDIKFYKTKGLANNYPDDRWVSLNKVLLNGQETNQYIGKFAFKVPVLGKVISFLRSLPGILFLSINAIAIVVAVKFMKKISKKQLAEKNISEDQ